MTVQKHPLATWRFYVWTILSGGIGGALLYFLSGWVHDYTYLSEPPQYPPHSWLFSSQQLETLIFTESVLLDVVVTCFFVGLAMAAWPLFHHYRDGRFGPVVVSLMLLPVGVYGASTTLISVNLTGTGWFAGIESGVLVATGLIGAPVLIVYTVKGLLKAGVVTGKLAKHTWQSYSEYRNTHKKNQVV